MKHILFFGLLSVGIAACSTTETQNDPSMAGTHLEDVILQKAIKRGDVATALSNIHIILEKDSTRTGLYDTLFQFYFQMENPEGVADVGQILLESKPNDIAILEATVMGLSAIKQYEKALALNQRLYALTGDARLKITIATLLFEMKKIDEARNEIQWIIDNRQTTDTIQVEQPAPSFSDGRTQQISLPAIAYYSLGQIEYTLGNDKNAVKMWYKALDISPRYDLAASSIQQLEK